MNIDGVIKTLSLVTFLLPSMRFPRERLARGFYFLIKCERASYRTDLRIRNLLPSRARIRCINNQWLQVCNVCEHDHVRNFEITCSRAEILNCELPVELRTRGTAINREHPDHISTIARTRSRPFVYWRRDSMIYTRTSINYYAMRAVFMQAKSVMDIRCMAIWISMHFCIVIRNWVFERVNTVHARTWLLLCTGGSNTDTHVM